MDTVQCVNKKVYLARFKNQDKLTFNQGVAGSNPAGLTTSLTGSELMLLKVAGATGLEPATSCVTERKSRF